MSPCSENIEPVKNGHPDGPDGSNPVALRHDHPDERFGGKPLADRLRFAGRVWHCIVSDGSDPFGGRTVKRPWFPADTVPADGAPLHGIAADAEARAITPQPASGAEGKLKNIVNRYV